MKIEMKGSLSFWCLNKRMTAVFAVLALIVTALIVPEAHAWWDGNWQQRMQVQFDASQEGAGISENLTDIPVLIRLHTGNFSFPDANEDGSDLRFVADDDITPLKYHIEKFDPYEEIALVWVKVPRITGGESKNHIWIYYGNSSADAGQDPGATYDASHVAVYHFGEEGGPKDSTAYGNHALDFSAMNIASVAGSGAAFGTSDRMTLPEAASSDLSRGFTFSAWVRLGHSSGNAQLFSWSDSRQSIIIGFEEAKPYLTLTSNQIVATPKTMALKLGKWHHLAVTAAPGGRVIVYVDGNEAASSRFTGTMPAPSVSMVIGGAFMGDIDEVQLSSTARSAGWIKEAFQSQGPEGALTSYMQAETGGKGELPLTFLLLGIIIQTITFDGWLIIGFLFMLGCAAAVVFVLKVMGLSETKRGNRAFSKAFRSSKHPLELHNEGKEFRGSSLYHAYRAGCESLKNFMERRGEIVGDGNGLTEKAMRGFKSSLEKEAMYASRRLSSGMIVLNLCVAGGPFLGLLGTVWGVMNTFASLAASGEANLTAIAPGIAAALATTLAGLLVAIPALFASSYIISNFKEINADMNVFVEDFTLRLDEERN